MERLQHFLRGKKRKILIIFIIGLLLLFSFLCINWVHSRVSIKASTVDSADQKLKLLTYNIFHNSLDNILPVLQEANADIIALQETDNSVINGTSVDAPSWLAKELNYYHYLDESGQTEKFGVSLISRWPITRQYNIELEVIDGHQSRVAVIGIIDSPLGEVAVMSTHLQQPYYWRDRIAQITEIVNESRNFSDIIIMGDFNTPDVFIDEGYSILTHEFSDGWITSGKWAIEGRTWPVDLPVLRIDYIWLKGDWKVLKSSARLYGNSNNSDHKAVYLEVCF